MTRREIFTHHTDGTGHVQGCYRDDARGRTDADKAAFALLDQAGVASVTVQATERVAMNRKGSHR